MSVLTRLSRKEYWDELYEKERQVNEETGDPGEVWFGEEIAVRVAQLLSEHADPTSSVLDVGCGNGYTLTLLHEEGVTRLAGCDYSEHSVALARAVMAQNGVDADIFRCDFLDRAQVWCVRLTRRWRGRTTSSLTRGRLTRSSAVTRRRRRRGSTRRRSTRS